MMDRGENDWKKFITDGESYLKTSINGYTKRNNVFTPDIIYHTVCMSIESYIMGYLLFHHQLPDNHTLIDLVDAVNKISAVDEDLYARILSMQRFQEAVCSLSAQISVVPQAQHVKEFLAVGESIRDYVTARLPLSAESTV